MKEDSLYRELAFAFPGGLLEDCGNRKDGEHLLDFGDSQNNHVCSRVSGPFHQFRVLI